jgi:hypothetical protein
VNSNGSSCSGSSRYGVANSSSGGGGGSGSSSGALAQPQQQQQPKKQSKKQQKHTLFAVKVLQKARLEREAQVRDDWGVDWKMMEMMDQFFSNRLFVFSNLFFQTSVAMFSQPTYYFYFTNPHLLRPRPLLLSGESSGNGAPDS